MIKFSESPPLKEKSMMVTPSASQPRQSEILFFLFSITALPFLLSKLVLKLTSSNSILTSNSFSAA